MATTDDPGWTPLAGVVAVATISVLPVFLTGALAVQIRSDLDVSVFEVGVASAAFFATAAIVSVLAGSVTERLGAVRAMRLAAGIDVVALAGIAAFVESAYVLVTFLALAGVANAVAQPAANLYLARVVPRSRQGTAFGVKQSAVPAATLLGGLAVPALALTMGWRWGFGLAAAAAVAFVVAPPGRRSAALAAGAGRAGRDTSLAPLAVLALGGGLAAASGSTLGVFLVSGAVDAGIGEGGAGLLFAGSSTLGLAVRVAMGVLTDRRHGRNLRSVAILLALGAFGYVALSTAVPAGIVVGALIAFGAGWSWPGLFVLAVVRTNPGAPAAASGIVRTGTSTGAVVGPLAFGLVVEHAAYDVAWNTMAACSLAAAAIVVLGRRLLLRDRERRATPLVGED